MLTQTGAQELSFATEIIIKSLIIQAVALSALWFMRRTSAAVKHLYLSIALLIVLALPIAVLTIPSLNVGIVSLPVSLQQASSTVQPSGLPSEPVATMDRASAAGEQTTEEHRAAAGTQSLDRGGRAGLLRPLITAWAIGTGGLLLWLFGGLLYTFWLSSKAMMIKGGGLITLLKEAQEQIGLARRVTLLETDRIKVPVVFGVSRPRLMLPSQAKLWPRERLRAIFIHELGHVKRHDILFLFLAKLACAMYWFNPLVWIMERNLFLASECACDDLVIARHFEPADYAEHLMDTSVELGADRNPVWATAAMAEGTAFKDRILSILNPNIRRMGPKPAHILALIVAAVVVSIPLAAFSIYEIVEDNNAEVRIILPNQGAELTESEPPESTDGTYESGVSSGYSEDTDFRAWRQALDVDDADMREHAATALGKRGDKRAVPYLIKMLGDPSASVREHTATALGELGDSRALEALAKTMHEDKDTRVREHAASALGNLGDSRAYEALLETFENDDDPVVRAHAAYGLGLLGDSRALGPLIEALRDRNYIIRWHAAMGLGELGDPRALDALSVALKDSAEEVRREARIARSKILAD
jgi:HEAT repeat protein/beta-lactamase regulating signal transducer with metallopeptidase domain